MLNPLEGEGTGWHGRVYPYRKRKKPYLKESFPHVSSVLANLLNWLWSTQRCEYVAPWESCPCLDWLSTEIMDTRNGKDLFFFQLALVSTLALPSIPLSTETKIYHSKITQRKLPVSTAVSIHEDKNFLLFCKHSLPSRRLFNCVCVSDSYFFVCRVTIKWIPCSWLDNLCFLVVCLTLVNHQLQLNVWALLNC